jgi:hypothetical protein
MRMLKPCTIGSILLKHYKIRYHKSIAQSLRPHVRYLSSFLVTSKMNDDGERTYYEKYDSATSAIGIIVVLRVRLLPHPPLMMNAATPNSCSTV